MPGENVETARAIYRAWASGDFSDVSWAAPDVEFVPAPRGPDAAVHRGLEAVSRAWGEWLREWDEFGVEAVDFLEVGDAVLVLTEFHGRGRASGVSIEAMPGASVFWFRDGLVTRLAAYTERGEGYAALGLPEPRG